MATHSSILAWKIPWTEKPGRLQSMGSQELNTTWQLNHHHHQNKFKMVSGTSLAVQWLRLCISNEGDMGSVPGWGTKIPQAVRHGKKKKRMTSKQKGDFFGGLVVKNTSANAGDTGDTVQALGQEDPLEKEMTTSPIFLPGKSHRKRSLAGYSLWCQKGVGQNLVTK